MRLRLRNSSSNNNNIRTVETAIRIIINNVVPYTYTLTDDCQNILSTIIHQDDVVYSVIEGSGLVGTALATPKYNNL